MAQLLADCREAWHRATFADHATTQEIKNNFSTRTRLFSAELRRIKADIDDKSLRGASTTENYVIL